MDLFVPYKEELAYDLEIDLEDMGCGDMLIAMIKAMRCIHPGQVLKARAFGTGHPRPVQYASSYVAGRALRRRQGLLFHKVLSG